MTVENKCLLELVSDSYNPFILFKLLLGPLIQTEEMLYGFGKYVFRHALPWQIFDQLFVSLAVDISGSSVRVVNV